MPEETTATAEAPPPKEADAAAAAEAKPEEPFLSFDHNGQQIPVTREQAIQLARAGAEYINVLEQQRLDEQNKPAKPEPDAKADAKADDDPMSAIRKEVEASKKEVAALKREQEKEKAERDKEKQAARIKDEMAEQRAKHAVTKGNEKAARLVEKWTLAYLTFNPTASVATAYGNAAKELADMLKDGNRDYVAGKIAASESKGEAAGGGSPGGQTKKFTGKDFMSGDLMKAVIANHS